MEAKELMINDWVYRYDKPIQVTDGIYRDKIYTKDYFDIVETKLNPIPLTEEILRSNGFEAETHNNELFRHKLHRHILCWVSDATYRVNVVELGNNHLEGKWFYVHEFQHALRLCGLNDLADNFKVIE